MPAPPPAPVADRSRRRRAPPPVVRVEPPPVRVEQPPARIEPPPMQAATPAVPVEPERRAHRSAVNSGTNLAAAPFRSAASGASRRAARLGTGHRRENVLGRRRHRAGAGRGVLPAVFDRSRLARAAGPRRDRHPHRHRAARRLRPEGGAALSGHRQRARRGGDRDPVLDLLRRARAVAPDSVERRVRAARARDRDRGAAVDSPRLAVHRRARPARRFCHAGAAVDRREPADPALRVSVAAEHRPRVGGEPQALAGAHDSDAGADDALSVGLGDPLSHRQPAPLAMGIFLVFAVAGFMSLVFGPRLAPDGGDRRRARANRSGGGGDAAVLRRLSGGGARLRRPAVAPLRFPADRRHRAAGRHGRARRAARACDRRCRGDARLRGLARDRRTCPARG